jgi:hypothetical protein
MKQGGAKQPPAKSAQVPVTKEIVEAVLTQDHFFRRREEWPLVQERDMQRMLLAHSKVQSSEAMRVVAGKSHRMKAPRWGDDLEKLLYARFPVLPKLFEIGREKIFLAGGCCVSLLHGIDEPVPKDRDPNHVSDVDADLFLVGLSSEAEANALLVRLMDAFPKSSEFYRSNFALTVRYGGSLYQFVLRIFPRPDQVLGGFDLSACAVGFSPELGGLVATPLGAFSQATRAVFVDTSRRSPTYEYRLCKYNNIKVWRA